VQVLEQRQVLPAAQARLTSCAPALLAAKIRRKEATAAAEAAACPFKPNISETSAKMVRLLGGGAKSSLGDAESSLGDAESSLGDAESSLGDADSSLGDAVSSLGDAG
jgi:hypothetical protein